MPMAAVTDLVPVRHMSVARGTLRIPSGVAASFSADQLAEARTAAVVACKDAARLLPSAPPFQLTDCFCDITQADPNAAAGSPPSWEATVSCVGYARATLETATLLGVAAALASLWDAAKHADPAATAGMRITDLHVVQNVEG